MEVARSATTKACLARQTELADQIDVANIYAIRAIRFLRVHPLRAADALQLAAAFVAAERRPPSLEMVTLDDRLANAAKGFAIIELTPVD
jgi:predicted nucleic acid-binding protein